MIISELGEMAGNWKCSWYFWDTVDIGDIGTSKQLCILAYVSSVTYTASTLYNRKVKPAAMATAITWPEGIYLICGSRSGE